MQNEKFMKLKILTLSILLLAFSSLVQAKILVRKCINVEEAPNFWYHPKKTSETKLLVFNEKQGVNIRNEELAFQRLNAWDDSVCLINVTIEDGLLDSHMVYFQKSETEKRLKLVAEVEFDNPIIGFVADGFLFNQSNRFFAPAPTHNHPADKMNVWSLEEEASWTPLDKVTLLSPTRIRIEFTNQSATDPLRIVTMRSR